MPKGVPNSGGYHARFTKDDLRERMREIAERIKQMERRERAVGELKKWLAARKLDIMDLAMMLREMKPKRADAPVTSKKPLKPAAGLHPAVAAARGKKMPIKGDPRFMRAIHEARIAKALRYEDVGAKCGVSGPSVANWESGRYVPREEARQKLVKFFDLPADLGAEATQRMMAGQSHRANGRAAEA